MQDFVHERRFAGAGNAGDDVEDAERHVDIHVFDIEDIAAADHDLAFRLAAFFRHIDLLFSAQIGQASANLCHAFLLCVKRSSSQPETTTLAAMNAGARADVDDIIRSEHRVFVMLDDDNGIAEVAQIQEGC